MLKLIGILLVLLLAWGCPAAGDPFVLVVEDIVYGQGETAGGDIDLEADLYLPDVPLSPIPAIVLIHGGGWLSAFGDRTNSTSEGFAAAMAAYGYAVLNIDYRLNGDAPTVPSADEARFQTAYPFLAANTAKAGAGSCIDAQTAVRWLRANAETYRIDENQILLAGHSAGAITALTCNYAPDSNFVSTHASNNLGESNAVAGAIAISGSAEVVLNEGWVDVSDPPAMIWHGDADENEYAEYDPFILGLFSALDTAGTTYAAYIEPGGGHFDYTIHNGLLDWETALVWAAAELGDPLHKTPRHEH